MNNKKEQTRMCASRNLNKTKTPGHYIWKKHKKILKGKEKKRGCLGTW